MCTVSFVPKSHGFYLAMNRDEKRDRLGGLSPAVTEVESHCAIFPREPTGGTWISANDAGICLALINWHGIQREPNTEVLSRGSVVRELAGKSITDQIQASITRLALHKLRPFRLITIVPSEKRVIEYRWNLERLAIRDQEWRRQHWFSSSFDEHRAEIERQRVCEVASNQQSADTLRWLRQLHRSHAPRRGPFSICMHRQDAATVSYTEIAVTKQRLLMRYKSGPTCSDGAILTRTISLAVSL
jgi:hypothetical protein